MTLVIDIGNTSAKYALYRGERLAHFERITGSWATTLSHIVANFGTPERVLISNVAGPQPELEAVLDSLRMEARWLTWQTPEAQRFFNGIPEGLGADRLAADVAARVLAPESDVLVVDAGTCLTFDLIRADGQYLGGSISPGAWLRLKAMHDHTAALPLITPQGDAPVIGTDIFTAMRGGCVNGMRWEIEGYVRHLLQNGYPQLRVFYTGGDDLQQAADVDACVIRNPYLIFLGLLAIYD